MSKLWTKELDLRLLDAVQHVYGDEICHGHQNATRIKWEEIVQNLVEPWPTALRSVEALKKRWENSFRIWYGKALPAAAGGGSWRATTISITYLRKLLKDRDYVAASRPGPRKGSKRRSQEELADRNGDDDNNDDHNDDHEDDEDDEQRDGADSHHSSSTPITTVTKRIRTSTSPRRAPVHHHNTERTAAEGLTALSPGHSTSDESEDEPIPPAVSRQLAPWLHVLRDQVMQHTFRLRFPSSAVELEPSVVVEAILRGGIAEPFMYLFPLARAMATVDAASHIITTTDAGVITKHVSDKKSCILVPCSDLCLGHERLLLAALVFPVAEQRPLFWCFVLDDTAEDDPRRDSQASAQVFANHTQVLQLLGLPRDEALAGNLAFTGQLFRFEASKTTNEVLLLSLYLLRTLMPMMSGHDDPATVEKALSRINDAWPNTKALRKKLLIDLLLTNNAVLLLAPPNEPLVTPYKSLLEAVQALGVKLPAWFNGIRFDKLQNVLDAIRDLTKTVVVVMSMRGERQNPTVLTWTRQRDDKELLLLAERNDGSLAVVVSMRMVTETQANLVVRANQGALRWLCVNHRALPITPQQEHQIDVSVRAAIDFKVEEVQGRLLVAQVQ